MDVLTAIVLTLVLIILVGMLSYVLFSKEKMIIHYLFITIICELLIWNIAVLMGNYLRNDSAVRVFVDNFAYFGAAFVPVTIMQLGIAYQKGFKGFSLKYLLFYLLPVITMIMIFTNGYHHLFYLSYSLDEGYTQGPYFYVYALYSYTCLLIGMGCLCYAAIKTSGLLSLQAVLIALGCVIPAFANICYTVHIPGFYVYTTPVAFTVTIMLYLISMFRCGFLKVIPIATRTVVNRISDCFVVVDRQLNILDCNRAFTLCFAAPNSSRSKNRLDSLMSSSGLLPQQICEIANAIDGVFESKTPSMANLALTREKPVFYAVEYTPLSDNRSCSAVIALFKDVTQHILDLRTIEENQRILLERERLASLGQMIGGIAHNLKSPIFAISGSVDQIGYLVSEYRHSTGDPDVTVKDHHEIAADMDEWLGKVKTQLAYMSDVISTVKGQAAQFSEQLLQPFTVTEVIRRTRILMQHSLTKNGCTLEVEVADNKDAVIIGDINSLVQVLDNIIDNAIQAYNGSGGQIRFEVENLDERIRFAIIDYGEPIAPATQKLLFKEMTTTKGKHGTGLGLYMSYSTIKGMFSGNMWFETGSSQTAFFIEIPLGKKDGS